MEGEHDDEAGEVGSKLTSRQRQFLRAQAHALKPVVQVGQGGITDQVVRAVSQALLDHELIKVRLAKPESKQATSDELASRTQAHLCGLIGHTVILYRPHPEKAKIKLPKPGADELP